MDIYIYIYMDMYVWKRLLIWGRRRAARDAAPADQRRDARRALLGGPSLSLSLALSLSLSLSLFLYLSLSLSFFLSLSLSLLEPLTRTGGSPELHLPLRLDPRRQGHIYMYAYTHIRIYIYIYVYTHIYARVVIINALLTYCIAAKDASSSGHGTRGKVWHQTSQKVKVIGTCQWKVLREIPLTSETLSENPRRFLRCWFLVCDILVPRHPPRGPPGGAAAAEEHGHKLNCQCSLISFNVISLNYVSII